MKLAIRSTLLLLALTLPVMAQNSEPLKTKALSFGFNGLSLSGYDGGVGGKLWLSNARALTMSLDGSLFSRTTEGDSSRTDDKSSSSEIRLNAGIEQHADIGQGFSPFLAAGLSLGYIRSRNSYGSIANPYVYGSHYTSFGAVAGLGLEYWITPRVSFAGLQRLSADYRIGKAYDGPKGSAERDSYEIQMGLGSTSLILSIYL